MKQKRDELESELRSLIPAAPSDRMVNGIADQLAPAPHSTAEQPSWTFGAIAFAVAACLALVIIWYPRSTETTENPSLAPVSSQREALLAKPPTMLAYRQVLVESPDAVDELLDRHAARLLVASSSGEGMSSLLQDLMSN